MTEKFRLFRRTSGVWYIEDRESREQESLRTRDATEAKRLFHAKNEAHRQPSRFKSLGLISQPVISC